MGWLGWTPVEAMGADVNLVLIAIKGREGLLQMIFGSGNSAPGKPGKMSAEGFKAFAAKHNRSYARRRANG